MIPIRDAGPRTRGLPLLTWLMIVANGAAFLMLRAGGEQRMQVLTYQFAAVPANVVGREPVAWALAEVRGTGFFRGVREQQIVTYPAGLSDDERSAYIVELLRHDPVRLVNYTPIDPVVPPWATLLTSMFMHGGWLHLLGNIVFLFVFGARLEDRLGVLRFLVFYLATGVAAALTHVASDPQSTVPMVGASGAISGLLGGYVLLWPHGRIVTLIPFWPFWTLQELPAFVFVGIWGFMQVLLIGGAEAGGGGVAVWAHLGGFAYGLALIKLFDPVRRRRPPRGGTPVELPPYVRRPAAWYDEQDGRWPG